MLTRRREKYVGTDYIARRDSERWQGERYGRGSTGIRGSSIYNGADAGGRPVSSASRSARRSRRDDGVGSTRRSRRSVRSYASDDDGDSYEERATERSSKRRRRRESEDEDNGPSYTGY